MSLDGGLEVLDQREADLETLIRHAASILNINVSELNPDFSELSGQTAPAPSFSFKEQWVLRWLSRKIHAEVQEASKKDADALCQEQLLDPKLWLLLLHVLRCIPGRVCAEILIERKFVQCLDQAIQLLLHSGPHGSRYHSWGVAAASSHYDEDGHSVKRRRLSPEPASITHKDKEAERVDSLLVQVLRVCHQIACIFRRSIHHEDPSEMTGGLSWSSTAKDNASMLTNVLHLLVIICNQDKESSGCLAMSCLSELTSFWVDRPTMSSDSVRSEEVSLFSTECLEPCLQLLQLPRTREAGDLSRHARKALEKLVATEVVLPLRKKFFNRHAKSWKLQSRCVTWKEVHKVYNGLTRVINLSFSSNPNEISMAKVTWAHYASTIYDIAIRLLPRGDLQRSQQEQPWLDALLIFLSYLSCPRLTKLEIGNDNDVEVLDPAYPSDLRDEVPTLMSLLEVAADQNHRPSLQVLGYLTSAVLSWQALDGPWLLLGQLVKLDPDVLVSNSGLVTSTFALEAFLNQVDTATVSQEDYIVLRDGVIVPLLEGYAHSRALKDFIYRWFQYLPEAIRKSNFGLDPDAHVPAVLVWQDEDLFEHLFKIYPFYGTTTLTQSLLSQLLEALSAITERAGSALDLFAQVAITTVIAESMTLTEADNSSKLFGKLLHAAIAAMKKRSDYQGQRWRLWGMIKVVTQKTGRHALAEEVLSVQGPQEVSLPDISKLLMHRGAAELATSRCRECFERFAFIAQEAGTGRAGYVQAFQAEIGALHSFITPGSPALYGKSCVQMWNGRVTDLNGSLQLISACLGVVLTRPKLLKTTPAFLLDLRRMKATFLKDADKMQLLLHTVAEVDNLNSSQEGMIEAWIATEGDDVLSISDLEYLWQDMSADRYKRALVKAFGDKMFAVLKEYAERQATEELVYLFAAMDWLSSSFSTSFTRAESLDDWIQVLTILEHSHYVCQRQQLIAVRSVEHILSRVWSRCSDAGLLARKISKLSSQLTDANQSFVSHHGIGRTVAFRTMLPFISALQDEEALSCKVHVDHYVESTAKDFETWVGSTEDAMTAHDLTLTIIKLQALLELACLLTVKAGLGLRESAIMLDTKLNTCTCEAGTNDLLQTAQTQCTKLCFVLSMGNAPPKSVPESLKDMIRLGQVNTTQGLTTATNKAHSLVSALDTEGIVELLTLVHREQWTLRLGVLQPILVGLAVASVRSASVLGSTTLLNSLDGIANLDFAVSFGSAKQLALSLENAKLTFDLHADLVHQNTIDTMLLNLCYLLSPNHRMDANSDAVLLPEVICDRICFLLGSLLNRFRRRLTDRHHLLVPVLQALLKCFFFPGKTSLQARQAAATSYSLAFVSSLPIWLRESEKSLPPRSATKLSRLLSTICNPTVSAAKSSRKRNHNELNDETKRVKAAAGQHMQYLVMEYARCSLDGEILSAVKEKLMPGMYTVLGAMGKDVMRAMNAAMDPSSRAIFKTLYDDWTRYGKWDKS